MNVSRITFLGLILFLCGHFACGQNVVSDDASDKTAPVVELSLDEVRRIVDQCPDCGGQVDSAPLRRVRDKLNRHVQSMVDDWPYLPFHHTLGISGSETCYGHPDELFCILSQATAYLDPSLANQVQQLLRRELDRWPPYAMTGFAPTEGTSRELYDVPAGLRSSQPVNAHSHLGVYAFWAYCHRADDRATLANGHWQPIKARCQRLLDEEYAFDIQRTDYRNDEAQVLNGDLAGLIGLVRLARLVDDQATEQQALRRAAQLLQLRVNLDRVNPVIVHSTQASTARLHHFKLTRYCDLVPEVARAVQLHSDDCASARLHGYRSLRNGWYIAAGDRLIGGENYTNPLHFSCSLFAGAALIEQLPEEELAEMIDVPWCKGDLYFIEKCVLALWASEGSKWELALQRQQ